MFEVIFPMDEKEFLLMRIQAGSECSQVVFFSCCIGRIKSNRRIPYSTASASNGSSSDRILWKSFLSRDRISPEELVLDMTLRLEYWQVTKQIWNGARHVL